MVMLDFYGFILKDAGFEGLVKTEYCYKVISPHYHEYLCINIKSNNYFLI